MTAYEIRNHDGAAAVGDLAKELTSAGLLPGPTPEMDPEYLAAGHENGTVCALVAYLGGRPVAYLPFALRRGCFLLRGGGMVIAELPVSKLLMFGYSSVGQDDVAILDRFFGQLHRDRQWQAGRVLTLPTSNPLYGYLCSPPALIRRAMETHCVCMDTWQVDLTDDSFEGYLQSRFNKKTRYNLRREVRLAQEQGDTSINKYHRPEEVGEFLRLAHDVARRTYQWRLGMMTVRDSASLHGRLSFLARRDRWRGYVMQVAGRPVAFCLASVHADRLCYERIGYDPAYAGLHPGKVLLWQVLEDLFAEQEIRHLDFGIGPADYKRLFATSQDTVFMADLFRHDPYPQTLRILDRALDRGVSWLKSAVERCTGNPYLGRVLRKLPLPAKVH